MARFKRISPKATWLIGVRRVSIANRLGASQAKGRTGIVVSVAGTVLSGGGDEVVTDGKRPIDGVGGPGSWTESPARTTNPGSSQSGRRGAVAGEFGAVSCRP